MINPVKSFLTHGPLSCRVLSYSSPDWGERVGEDPGNKVEFNLIV